MFYVILGMGLLFFGLGFMITENNASSLLSGYNTMSKEEQEQFPLTEYLERFKGFHIRFGSCSKQASKMLSDIESDTLSG